MPGDYYHHHYPNWDSSSPSPNKMDNTTNTRPSFPSFMYESPYPPHNYYHPYPSSSTPCFHSCCHSNHTHYPSPPPYPTPTPHPYTYSPPPPPPYYQPNCCSGGGYPMTCYSYPPPPSHYAMILPEYEGKGGFPYPYGHGFPRHWPYPYGSKREDGNVKIEEHEEEEPIDPSNKEDTMLKLVPSANSGAMNVFPYPWVPSGFMEEDKDKGKNEKPKSLGREERLQVPDHVMNSPLCYYPNPKAAFVQEPKGHKAGGWFPLDTDKFGFPWQGGDVRGQKDGDQQQELQKGKKSNQVPLIWMPYYSHSAENDDDQAKGRKERSAETENMRNEQPLLRQSEGSMRKEEDHADREKTDKNRSFKIIPVKQIYDDEPVHMGCDMKINADSKKYVDETKGNKESNGDKKKSKTSSQTKPSLPPVCLRVDPLPKKNKNGKSRSPPPPPSRKEQKQGDSSLKSDSPLASKEEAPNAGEQARSAKDKSNVEQSSKKEIRVTDAVDSSASQTRIEVSRNHAKHADTEMSKAAADKDKASLDVANLVNGGGGTGVNASSRSDSHAISEDKDEGSKMPESGEVKHVEEESAHEQEKRKKIMSGTEAAIVIQSAYRGYEVRRWGLLEKLRHIAKVSGEAAQLRTRIEALESGDSAGHDFSKEKAALGETIMKLLLELDTIKGLHPSFRNMRKALALELLNLQEKLDSITTNVKVKSCDGETSLDESTKLVMKNSDEGMKIGEERETMIQKDMSPDSKQVPENGSIAISDATTNFNSEKSPYLVNEKAQDLSKEEVVTSMMVGTGTKVEEPESTMVEAAEASMVQEHEKEHDEATLEFANEDAHRESQDEITVLESSSIEKHNVCNEGELMGGQIQEPDEALGGSILAHSRPVTEADEGDAANAINEESNRGSLIDTCSSFAANEDRGVIAEDSAESPPIEEMAKGTQKEVEGQDSTPSPKLKESHEVDLSSGLPHVVTDEETAMSPLDIARLPDSGGLDAHKAELPETVHNEGLCCGELEFKGSGEQPRDASPEHAEGSRDVEMTDGTSKRGEEVVNSSGSLQPNVVTAGIEVVMDKDESPASRNADAAKEKKASCEEDNVTRDDTERSDDGGILSDGSTDEIGKIKVVTAASEGEGVLDKGENHAWKAAFVVEGKDACEENNLIGDDAQRNDDDGIKTTEKSKDVEITDESDKVGEEIVDLPNSLQANVVAETSEGVLDKDEDLVSETAYLPMDKDASCEESNLTQRGDDQCSIERSVGTEVAHGSGTSNLQDSSYCPSESRDETQLSSRTRCQGALHEEPEIGRQLTEENKMMKEMIEKLIASGKEQQDVISNLNGKIKELEKKLVKKNTKGKTGKQRPRILMHTKPSKSALSRISKEGVPS